MSRYVLEIGLEDLPADEIDVILNSTKNLFETFLKEERIDYEKLNVMVSPHRISVCINNISENQREETVVRKGPPLRVCYDALHNPTNALLGFAKSNNIDVEDTYKEGLYIYAKVTLEAEKTSKVLSEKLPQLLSKIECKKPMKWGEGEYSFVRPIHWTLSLMDDKVIEFEFMGEKASNKTKSHRLLKKVIEIKDAQDYEKVLKENNVIVDQNERFELIKNSLENSEFDFKEDTDLIKEISYITDYPKIIISDYDEKYLKLPEEVIVASIKGNLKAFPLYNKDTKPINKFAAFVDGEYNELNIIKTGYSNVVNSRLDDAYFYYKSDLKKTLEDRLKDLKSVTYQKELGSLYDKVQRIIKISGYLKNNAPVLETAKLCKSDLVTHLVYEFPDLQGTMGRIYAQHEGLNDEIAFGIEEHYKPVSLGSELPKTEAGAYVSIADKIDTIVGLFLIGKTPMGSNDQFGIRRRMNAVIYLIKEVKLNIDVLDLIQYSSTLFEIKGDVDKIKDYYLKRMENIFTEYYKYKYDFVQGAYPKHFNPFKTDEVLKVVSSLPKEKLENLVAATARSTNITKKHDSTEFDESLFNEKEKPLYEAYLKIKDKVSSLDKEMKYLEVFDEILSIKPIIDKYFDDIMVNAEDEKIRNNRLGFNKSLSKIFKLVFDFSKVVM
jgi:glycyl-tRNA synthetase beta chain